MRQQAPPPIEEPRKAESPPVNFPAILNVKVLSLMRQQAPPPIEEPRKAESPPIDFPAILNVKIDEI